MRRAGRALAPPVAPHPAIAAQASFPVSGNPVSLRLLDPRPGYPHPIVAGPIPVAGNPDCFRTRCMRFDLGFRRRRWSRRVHRSRASGQESDKQQTDRGSQQCLFHCSSLYQFWHLAGYLSYVSAKRIELFRADTRRRVPRQIPRGDSPGFTKHEQGRWRRGWPRCHQS